MDYTEWFEKMFINEARAAVDAHECSNSQEDIPAYEGEVEVT